jgi:SNF2 family DNA or RNA helicase
LEKQYLQLSLFGSLFLQHQQIQKLIVDLKLIVEHLFLIEGVREQSKEGLIGSSGKFFYLSSAVKERLKNNDTVLIFSEFFQTHDLVEEMFSEGS